MKIKFVPGSKDIEELVPCLEPSKFSIPQWYKDIPGGKDLINVKKCVPFLDSMSHGYIQKTWTDIHIRNSNGLEIFFDHKVPILKHRERLDLPVEESFYNIELIWQRPWSMIFPDNYSGLITHPLNRIDLPFITLTGIVDLDKSIHASIGNIPFYIKKDFSGTIPAGTPMFQVIPIHRDDWESERLSYSEQFWNEKHSEKGNGLGFYKKKIWQKKSFD